MSMLCLLRAAINKSNFYVVFAFDVQIFTDHHWRSVRNVAHLCLILDKNISKKKMLCVHNVNVHTYINDIVCTQWKL